MTPQFILAAALACFLWSAPAHAQDAGEPGFEDRSLEWQLARGGRLYDNWFAAQLLAPPDAAHPMLPAGSDIPPASSWRCSTCHGWDYRGRRIEGRDRVLDVPSLESMRGAGRTVIESKLRAPPHGFDASVLPDESLRLVARFVSEGQHDVSTYADPLSGAARGRPRDGRPIYQGVCISCHDVDGRAYIEGEPGDKESLGWVSRNRTAQALHKSINGQPGTDMVQLRFLNDAQISDLLAYMQTLPDP